MLQAGRPRVRNPMRCIFFFNLPNLSDRTSSWLKIQRSGFDSRRYWIFREVVGLERGPLSLVSTTEELLGRKISGSGLETEITAVGIRCADYATPLDPKTLALTSPTSGGRSVGIVRSRTCLLLACLRFQFMKCVYSKQIMIQENC
jgi:hypothetical protein